MAKKMARSVAIDWLVDVRWSYTKILKQVRREKSRLKSLTWDQLRAEVRQQLEQMEETARLVAEQEAHSEIEEREQAQHIARGRKVVAGSKAAHAKTHGTPEQKAARWKSYQDWIVDLHALRPTLSYSDLQRRAAAHFKTAKRTIQRHTSNPKK